MARKSAKTVYERIEDAQNKITQLENELKKQKTHLLNLNKEKDELEMRQMFEYAKENNLSLDEIIKAVNLFSLNQKHSTK